MRRGSCERREEYDESINSAIKMSAFVFILADSSRREGWGAGRRVEGGERDGPRTNPTSTYHHIIAAFRPNKPAQEAGLFMIKCVRGYFYCITAFCYLSYIHPIFITFL
jgi:hypothetical protein